MRVLVTRPLADARRMAAQLAGHGHEAVFSPAISMQAKPVRIPPENFDLVAATSAYAFAFLDENDPGLPRLRKTPLFVVGPRTARAARERGFAPPEHIAADAAELAVHIAGKAKAGVSALYLAGENRKADFEKKLREAGLMVSVIEVYRAVAARELNAEAAALLGRGEIDAILHFSRRSAEIFSRLAQAAGLAGTCADIRHLCLSADVAAGLALLDPQRVAVAEKPSAEALLALL